MYKRYIILSLLVSGNNGVKRLLLLFFVVVFPKMFWGRT